MKARKKLNVVKLMARDGMPQRILCLLFDMLVLSKVDYGFGLFTLSKTRHRIDSRLFRMKEQQAVRTIESLPWRQFIDDQTG